MIQVTYADRINAAVRRVPKMSERALADMTGLSQPTLNRIKRGERQPKMNELIVIAAALGCSVTELTGDSPVAARLVSSARITADGAADEMQAELTHYFELDDFLRNHGYRPV